jgi:hypothetical protein
MRNYKTNFSVGSELRSPPPQDSKLLYCHTSRCVYFESYSDSRTLWVLFITNENYYIHY